ncbi:hypothetical protein O6H91_12G096000 [Diphasiastrum complanatum]|nr:hypothetical protein O6H91_12G096000 [Diphasiastrum complanatum]
MEDQLDKSEPKISDAERDWKVVSFSHVEHLGGTAPLEAELPAPDDIAIIMYTSGSTALPKGVMISHANMVAVTASVIVLVPGLDATDTYLAYLPLAHALELAAEMASCMKGVAIGYGSPLTMTNTSSKIKKGTNGDLSELRPTLLTTVPAILDRMRDVTRQMVDAKGGLSKHLYDLAYGRRLAAIEGSWFGAWGFEKLLWDVLIFRKVRQMIGGRVRGVISGGAPLSHDAQRFVNVCFGVPIVQGYGLTETAAGSTFSEWDDTSVGRVGPPMPHCYIKLVNWEEGGYLTTDEPMPRGEVVIGGLNITKGYFKNQAKTDESYKVDERGLQWFYTGDIGRFHPDGCLEIVDRKKDIVKLQHGEYISLGKVEAVMSVSPYVDIIMLHADPFHSHCVALIVPSRMALETWAKKTNLNYEDFPDLCQRNEVVHEVLKSLLEVGNQAKLHRFEIPTRVKLFPETWTPESGLVTDSLKIKREKIRKVYADALQDLYKS